jgi:hypothetical protein
VKGKSLYFKYIAIFSALCFFAHPFAARANDGNTATASHDCYLSEHGDVRCPKTNVISPGYDAPGVPGTADPARLEASAPVGTPVITPIMGLGKCEGQNPQQVFLQHARAREGYSNKVRRNAMGELVVGIGHRVTPEDHLAEGDEITDEKVKALWEDDSWTSFNAAMAQAKEAGICDPCFIAALAVVNTQQGTKWRVKHPYAWAHILAGNYDQAAKTIQSTRWYEKTPVLVRDFQMALRALPPKPPSCTIGSGVPGHPVNPAPNCSTTGWLSGAFEPQDAFEALREGNPAKLNICLAFGKVSGDWAAMHDISNGSIGSVDQWVKAGCKSMIVSVPLFPTSFKPAECGANYRRVADGEFDDHYIAMAIDLKNAGVPANSVLRIGWDLNLKEYPWALTGCQTKEDAQAYVEGFRHIVDVFRMYFGGQFNVSWNFNGNMAALPMPAESYYPGDGYVDYIGVNAYDSTGSLDQWLSYAQSKGKKLGIDEWATKKDGADFVQSMYEWFQLHSCQLGYESYFNGCGFSLGRGENPSASSTYAKLWGQSQIQPLPSGGQCSCTPTTTPPPTPGSPPPPPECTPATAQATVNPGNFSAALASLSGGQTIVLAPGNYPALNLSGKNFGGSTIQCAQPSQCNFGNSVLKNVAGLTIDGIKITRGGVGLDIDDSQDITVRCSTFVEQSSTGVLLNPSRNPYEGNSNIVIDKNVFSNNSVGCNLNNKTECETEVGGSNVANMDYGIRIYDAKSVYIRQNVFGSIFNHAISFKDGVIYGLVDSNTFNSCERHCVQLGQEPNTMQTPYRSVRQVDVTNNTMSGKAITGVLVQNIEKANITNNTINVSGNAITIWPSYNKCGPSLGGCPLRGNGFPANREINQSGNH